jgi:hypothetical protein
MSLEADILNKYRSISKARRHLYSDLFDILLQIFRFLLCLYRAENLLTSAMKGSRNSECDEPRLLKMIVIPLSGGGR